jgi:hypothetical protein
MVRGRTLFARTAAAALAAVCVASIATPAHASAHASTRHALAVLGDDPAHHKSRVVRRAVGTASTPAATPAALPVAQFPRGPGYDTIFSEPTVRDTIDCGADGGVANADAHDRVTGCVLAP